MARVTIQVTKQGEGSYEVRVREGGGSSRHAVSLTEAYYRKLTGGSIAPEELIRRSFEFLLQREPKESILSRFELPLIQRYFPEYERTIGNR